MKECKKHRSSSSLLRQARFVEERVDKKVAVAAKQHASPLKKDDMLPVPSIFSSRPSTTPSQPSSNPRNTASHAVLDRVPPKRAPFSHRI